MGNFFTSTQIHNPEQLSKEQFIELFCNKMKKNGFDVSNAEDHEISYVLAFADSVNAEMMYSTAVREMTYTSLIFIMETMLSMTQAEKIQLHFRRNYL